MTQTTQTHTATPRTQPPWEVRGFFNDSYTIGSTEKFGKIGDINLMEDAAFIVEAVNSHSRLLSENKAMKEALEACANALQSLQEAATEEAMDRAAYRPRKPALLDIDNAMAANIEARAALSLSQVKP